MRAFRCPRRAEGRVCSRMRTSSTAREPTPFTVRDRRRHASSPGAGGPGGALTKHRWPPVRPARSGRTARSRGADDGSAAAWARMPRIGCAAAARRRPTPRRCASARSGSGRPSPKPRTGAVCGASEGLRPCEGRAAPQTGAPRRPTIGMSQATLAAPILQSPQVWLGVNHHFVRRFARQARDNHSSGGAVGHGQPGGWVEQVQAVRGD